MTQRKPIATLWMVGALMAAGCPATKTSDVELAAAQAALDDARANRANDCATEIFMAAEATIREAKELADKGEHDSARAKAAEGESLANQARGASPPGCDKDDEEVAGNQLERDTGADTSNASANMSLGEMLDTVYFDYNQAQIRSDSKEHLTRLATHLASKASARIEIEGHCDVRGSTEYNLHLGERRARSVMKYLVTQGVSSDQIATISYGEERPVDLGDTETAHQRNRRAELKPR